MDKFEGQAGALLRGRGIRVVEDERWRQDEAQMGLLLSLLLLRLNERVVAGPRRVGGGSRTRSKYLRRGVTAVTILVPYSYAIYATYELGITG